MKRNYKYHSHCLINKRAIQLCIFFLSLTFDVLSHSEHESVKQEKQNWTFQKPFGTFNREALQRGYQVYKEVCSACHGLKRVAYRNLSALGFNEDEIKSLAASTETTDGPNDEGKMFERPSLPKDYIHAPFPNDNAARTANNGALPPDLSLIVKARAGGADYIYNLLTGYKTPPKGLQISPGQHYNTVFPNNQISMPAPLQDGQVTFADNTKATVDQMAHDVVTFLSWAAEPEMEHRKQLGVKVMLYLMFMTGLFYAAKRRIWKNIHKAR